MRRSPGFRNLFFTLFTCVCALLAFSTGLSATSTVFVLGNNNNLSYNPSSGGTIPAGPYSGTLGNSSATLFFCLSGNLSANWDTSYNGTDGPPSVQQGPLSVQVQEEAAFLASLMLFTANQNGINITSSLSGGYESMNQTQTGAMSVSTFVNTVEGPISMAIWQLTNSLPTQDGVSGNDSRAAPFVAQAQAAWTNWLSNPSNPMVQTFNSNVSIFVPTGGGTQSFVSAFSDSAFISVATPEPGTIVLFGTGVLLVAAGCVRRHGRRSR